MGHHNQQMQKETIRADLRKDPSEVAQMFDEVANHYDLANDVLSLGQVYLWRKALNQAAGVAPGMKILDVAAGTGTSSAALQAAGADVTAVDLSEGMLAKAKAQHADIDFVLGSATDLPFASDTFDAATISFGLRNVDDVETALKEMWRVLRPGGQILVLEFSRSPRVLRPFHEAYLNYVAPTLARLVSPAGSAYDYLSESILDWYDQEQLAQLLADAGFVNVAHRNLTFGAVAIHRASKPVTDR